MTVKNKTQDKGITMDAFLDGMTESIIAENNAGKADLSRIAAVNIGAIVAIFLYMRLWTSAKLPDVLVVLAIASAISLSVITIAELLARALRKMSVLVVLFATFSGMYEEMTVGALRSFAEQIENAEAVRKQDKN